MTGTGIVPDSEFTLRIYSANLLCEFTLRRGDVVEITIDGVGTLSNPVN